jgi:hypothetical protein
MGDLRMNKENSEQVQNHGLPNPLLAGLLMGVVALMAPYGLNYYPDGSSPRVYVQAAVWMLLISPTWWHFEVATYLSALLEMFFYLIYYILYIIGIRILFAIQTIRYFQGKTTRKHLIIFGMLAELPYAPLQLWEILRFVNMIINRGSTNLSIGSQIPIPCMLVLVLLLLRFFPAQGESDWYLKRETEEWWLETGPDSAKVEENKLPQANSYPTTVKLNGGDEFSQGKS